MDFVTFLLLFVAGFLGFIVGVPVFLLVLTCLCVGVIRLVSLIGVVCGAVVLGAAAVVFFIGVLIVETVRTLYIKLTHRKDKTDYAYV